MALDLQPNPTTTTTTTPTTTTTTTTLRSPNPTQQGILYPVASSGRGFNPKPPLQNSVTVATNNNVTTTTAATTTTTTSGVGVGYPPRPLVSYPQVHVMSLLFTTYTSNTQLLSSPLLQTPSRAFLSLRTKRLLLQLQFLTIMAIRIPGTKIWMLSLEAKL
ncbi:uncharacterized protein LOC136069897 [Quercus suber]|uniref:uncharacterized protein LOC136069897 n=1 Tax=Quercus suber TaxID=58331 RepID=UPI0032DE4BD9